MGEEGCGGSEDEEGGAGLRVGEGEEMAVTEGGWCWGRN